MAMVPQSLPTGRLLGNDRLRTLVTMAGTGGTWLDDLSLTRWRGDRVQDEDGEFVFVRDLATREFWPIALRPGPPFAGRYDVDEGPAWLAITREQGGLSARIEIWVDAQRPVVCRRIVLHNQSSRSRLLDLTTWHEIVLDHARAFAAHPAFSKLFIQTEFVPQSELVLARRRPRAPGEAHPWLAHGLWGPGPLEIETDRARFLGRGGSLERPVGLRSLEPLSGTVGSVLDPAFVHRRRVTLAPGTNAEWVSVLIATTSRDEAVGIAEAMRATGGFEASRDAADGSAARASAARGLDAEAAIHAERIAVAQFYGDPRLLDPEAHARLSSETLADPLHGPFTMDERRARSPARPTQDSAIPDAVESSEAEPLRAFNGWGGFSADGREYVIRLRRDATGDLRRPPMPWVNVLANERFGCLVSEGGSISTWSRNSRTYRLTPWRNDPVQDPHDEALYVRDQETGDFWSPLPGPVAGPGSYEVRHGFGATRFRHAAGGLATTADVFVPVTRPVRVLRLQLENRGSRPRRLSVVSYQRLLLGDHDEHGRTIVTSYDAPLQALLARQTAPPAGIQGSAFATVVVDGPTGTLSHTADREAFLGRGGNPGRPASLERGEPLDGRTGAGLEPCFAHRVEIEIAPGETRTCAFVLGDCQDPRELAEVLEALRTPGGIDRLEQEVRDYWTDLVDRVQIQTPVESIDLMVNGWLMYQTLACRLWGRTAFYQSGGAFGFRDQLQDAGALLAVAPDLTRRQLLLHAAHQFPEGDVLHWWHPPGDQGIRTRFADDLLWLPEATANYVRTTGDRRVLEERVGFVTARDLEPGEDEAFLTPEPSETSADLYEHCCRAIDRSLGTGAHGLPRFGSGDWNDGMNRVGRAGKGESVWMGFFLYSVLEGFIPLCEGRGDATRIARYRDHQKKLQVAIADSGWDGEWYRRGYYDDGTPLGSKVGDECRIDALVQAWSVLSGAAPRARAEQAMDAVLCHLVAEPEGIIRLLTPAFDRTAQDPGYIKGYVPGVRENGGQYTHAALWVVRALAQLGRHESAARLLEMLSPVSHGMSEARIVTYRVEPYVVAADVYGEPPHVGRGGWTWYTGSAGWMLRVALESLLGVSVENGRTLVVRPALPASWPEYRLRLRPLGLDATYAIVVRRSPGVGGPRLEAFMDGQPLEVCDGSVSAPLADDGVHHEVTVFIGSNLEAEIANEPHS